MRAILLLPLAASALVLQTPPAMVQQQAVSMQSLPAAASIFPTTSLLAGKAEIEAYKAAKAAKDAAVVAAEAEAPPKVGTITARPCPDAETLLTMGSSSSGRMISRSCSAQLNQQITIKKQVDSVPSHRTHESRHVIIELQTPKACAHTSTPTTHQAVEAPIPSHPIPSHPPPHFPAGEGGGKARSGS